MMLTMMMMVMMNEHGIDDHVDVDDDDDDIRPSGGVRGSRCPAVIYLLTT